MSENTARIIPVETDIKSLFPEGRYSLTIGTKQGLYLPPTSFFSEDITEWSKDTPLKNQYFRIPLMTEGRERKLLKAAGYSSNGQPIGLIRGVLLPHFRKGGDIDPDSIDIYMTIRIAGIDHAHRETGDYTFFTTQRFRPDSATETNIISGSLGLTNDTLEEAVRKSLRHRSEGTLTGSKGSKAYSITGAWI